MIMDFIRKYIIYLIFIFTCCICCFHFAENNTCSTTCVYDYGESCVTTENVSSCKCREGFVMGRKVCEDTNECESNSTNNCHIMANCENYFGSYNCSCKNGFQGNGTDCEDINECSSLNNTICHEHAQCTNIPGSYNCTCRPGYYGNGKHCEELMCQNNTCGIGEKCTVANNRIKCACAYGFKKGRKVCEDINECESNLTNNCHRMANCYNIFGSYNCSCKNGFQGNGTGCEDINECENTSTHNCHQHAECDNLIGSFRCQCKHGFEGNGTSCKNVNECSDGRYECHSDAWCKDEHGTYQCYCNRGFVGNGTACKDVDECNNVTSLCHQNATCHNTRGSYNCICHDGFYGDGKLCKDINECENTSTHNCHQHAVCDNLIGSFRCQCKQGFEGNGTSCNDINECSKNIHSCHEFAKCQNTLASYKCICKDGFDGNGTSCTDINECKTNPKVCAGEHQTCQNLNGTYECQCKQGFNKKINQSCEDIDECSTVTCPANSQCQNTIGSYQCICQQGFERNGSSLLCQDINECGRNTSICHQHAVCNNTHGSFKCNCKEEFIGNGTVCRKKTCSETVCPENMQCIETHSCQCKPGFIKKESTCEPPPQKGVMFLVKDFKVNMPFNSQYNNKSSTAYLRFVYETQLALYSFINDVYTRGNLNAVQILDVRRGSVVIDFIIVYPQDERNLVLLKSLSKEIEYGLLQNKLLGYDVITRSIDIKETNACDAGFSSCNLATQDCVPLGGLSYRCDCKLGMCDAQASKLLDEDSSYVTVGLVTCLFIVIIVIVAAFLCFQRKLRRRRKQVTGNEEGKNKNVNIPSVKIFQSDIELKRTNGVSSNKGRINSSFVSHELAQPALETSKNTLAPAYRWCNDRGSVYMVTVERNMVDKAAVDHDDVLDNCKGYDNVSFKAETEDCSGDVVNYSTNNMVDNVIRIDVDGCTSYDNISYTDKENGSSAVTMTRTQNTIDKIDVHDKSYDNVSYTETEDGSAGAVTNANTEDKLDEIDDETIEKYV